MKTVDKSLMVFLFTLWILQQLQRVFTGNFCEGVSRDKRPHPNNCHQYIQCHDGYTYVQRCSIGLCFNPDTQDCDIRQKEEVKVIGKTDFSALMKLD